MTDFDLAIIGGGINGAGLARDAAGRGLRVILVEQNDLASGTSSASSKLVHGGVRYLERGAFRLVREALTERETLLRIAPHVVRPMRFVLPVSPEGRSPWLLRFGLFLYDMLGARRILPPAQTIDLSHHAFGVPLRRPITQGFAYSDCWVDDARLVVLNARDAADRGADIRVRTKCVRVEREKIWRLSLNSRGQRDVVTARVLVDATGPWHNNFSDTVLRIDVPRVRLVKGSHLVVPRLYEHDSAYILQNTDGRVVFTIPFAEDFTLIGTTDVDFDGDLSLLSPSSEEISYLCSCVNAYFRKAVSTSDVVRTFSGVRALFDDGARAAKDATRDYVVRLDRTANAAPLLSIYGGKITTYRRLAETALAKVGKIIGGGEPWTGEAPLPGGDFAWSDLDLLISDAENRWPFLATRDVHRLVGCYGTRVADILGNATTAADLGISFGAGLTEAEVRYLMGREWARDADDVLWRRTKLGMHVSADQAVTLDAYMRARVSLENIA